VPRLCEGTGPVLYFWLAGKQKSLLLASVPAANQTIHDTRYERAEQSAGNTCGTATTEKTVYRVPEHRSPVSNGKQVLLRGP
jgi:hypothetical protein